MRSLSDEEIRAAVQAALDEDIGPGDVTTRAVLPEAPQVQASLVSRQALVVCGTELAALAFQLTSRDTKVERLAEDGQHLEAHSKLMSVSGSAHSILSAERVALNFMQRLSGIATTTARFVNAVAGTHARILDTRKTTPGWRRFEKYAVACGGGQNHRLGLYDMILIKDNHLAALRGERPNPIEAAVRRARQACPKLKVEVEADTLEQVRQALDAGADMILLDNMPLEDLRTAAQWASGRAATEASGGVTLASVKAIAETGVDFISVGALTHSSPAVDIGLDLEASRG